jgi:nucleotide-binding universal stress UspA family protein
MDVARRVIVGASGSPGSVRAMRYARDLAANCEAALVVAYAWALPGGEYADLRSPSPILGEVWRNIAWHRVMASVEAAWGGMPLDVPTSLVIARGNPGQVLTALADRGDDLLVVGAGRRGPLARISHGQVARYCLTRATCPVLAIPPAALERYARKGLRGVFRHHVLTAAEVASEQGR